MIGTKSIERIEHIYSEDPALDRDAEDFAEKWARFRDGSIPAAHVPCKPGCKPTVFHIRGLSRKALLHVLSKQGAEQAMEALALGVVGATDFEHDGRPVVIKRDKSDAGERLSETTLEAFLALPLIVELSARVLSLCDLHPTIGQGF